MGLVASTQWALIAVALAFTAHFTGRFRKAAPAVVFLGIIALGTSGKIVALVARLLSFVMGVAGGLATHLLGYTISTMAAVLVAVLVYLFLHGLHPKNSASSGTFWIAVVLGVMVAAAATPFAALNNLPATVNQGVSQTTGG
jgi:hypothetical protein